MLKANTFKFTASPDEGGWSQVHDFTPDDPITQKKRGRLIAVISMLPTDENLSQGVDAVVLGREIISRLHEEYYGNTTFTSFNALKNALEKVISEYEKEGEIEISAGSIVNKVLYTAVGGGGQASILRKGLLATILTSTKGKSITASGYPQKEDRMILGTSGFFNSFAQGTLNAALQKESIPEGIESLAPTIHSKEKKGNIGAVVLEFKEEEQEEVFESPKKSEVYHADQRKITLVPKENVFNRFKSKLRTSFPDRSLYVKRETPEEVSKRKKMTVITGIVLLILLVISIAVGLKQKNSKEKEGLYSQRLNQAQHELEEAEKIAPLNPTRARELFAQSREMVLGLRDEGIEDERLENMLSVIEQKELEILGERTTSSDLFVDLSLLTEGFEGTDLTFSQGIMYILDENSGKIVEVVVDTKRSRVVAGPNELEGVRGIASYVDIVYLEKGDGIYRMGNDSRLIENDWPSNSLLYAYGGNLYILNSQDSDIFRFAGTESGFGSGRSWFASGINRDLSEAIDWNIDGAIWILSKEAEVQKFLNGVPQNFRLAPVYPEIINLTKIYSDDESEYLYLLDIGLGRIFVFDKEGAYKAQYVNEKLKNAVDFAVSENQDKIIFLTGEALESIEINH